MLLQETTNKERAIRRLVEELEKLEDTGNQNKNRFGASSSANLGKNLPSASATRTENEKYAKALLIAVREEIYKQGYKSANKLRQAPSGHNEKRWKTMEKTRRSNASAEVRSIRALAPSCFGICFGICFGTNSYFPMIEKALSAKGHNCFDLALAGIAILDSANNKVQARMVSLIDFDHAIILLGNIPSRGLSRKMEDWPSHLAICDPWANIACSAPEYVPRAIEKMEKWERRGKKIYDYNKKTFCNPNYSNLERDLRGRHVINSSIK